MNIISHKGRPWAPRNSLMAAFWSREAVATSGAWYGRLGTGLNATLVGDAVVTAETGLVVDGNGDYAQIPVGACVKGLSQATLCCWFRPTAAPSANAAIWMDTTSDSGYSRFSLYQLTDRTLLAVGRDTDTGGSFTVAGPALTNATWYHLAMTYNADTDYMQLYVNAAGQTPNTASKGAFPSSTPYINPTCGAIIHSTTGYINGKIDNVFLWSRALTAAEVRGVMQRSMRK